MIVVRLCPMCGAVTQRNLDITETQVMKYESGTLIQHAFPKLNANEREFFKTGYCDDCQHVLFDYEDEEE